MAWTVSGNLKGPKGDTGLTGLTGQTGQAGAGVSIAGTVATYSALPTGLGAGDSGKGYLVSADGKLYVWDGTKFPANGAGANFQGPSGTSATIAVGSVTALGAGASPTITNVGTSQNGTFNFGIPAGATGATGTTGTTGAAATISVGSVTPLSAGATPTISNSGSSAAAVLNFGIPNGAAGTNGATGAAASISIGSASPLSAGATPTVTNSGTSSAAVLNFGIPNGAAGTNGTNGSTWFNGSSAPGTIAGSVAGDYYLDVTSGDVYKLS